jgi:hypothetical protein
LFNAYPAATAFSGPSRRPCSSHPVVYTQYDGEPISLNDSGEYLLRYRAQAGSQSTPVAELAIKLDTNTPEVSGTIEASNGVRTLSVTATDATSGIGSIEYRLNDDITGARIAGWSASPNADSRTRPR